MPSTSKTSQGVHRNATVTEEVVENAYRDYSGEVDVEMHSPDFLHQMKGGNHSFPVKLHFMLEEIEKDGGSSIVSWQPHGRCFVVHKRKEFVENILPLWFVQSKYTSFQRQLNLYGFRRKTTGLDKGGYYHEMFLRGRRFLCKRIQRTVCKGRGCRKPASPETEPDFYLMSTCSCPTKKAPMEVPSYPLVNRNIPTHPIPFSLNSLMPLMNLNSLLMAQRPGYLGFQARAGNGDVTCAEEGASSDLAKRKAHRGSNPNEATSSSSVAVRKEK